MSEKTQVYSSIAAQLSAIRRGEGEGREAQKLMELLIPADGRRRRDHWQRRADELLVVMTLHVIYGEGKKDPHKLLDLLTDPRRSIRDLLTDPRRSIRVVLQSMLQTRHLGDRVHPLIDSVARDALSLSDDELAGVVATAAAYLGLGRSFGPQPQA